jgi:UPF0755 protein
MSRVNRSKATTNSDNRKLSAVQIALRFLVLCVVVSALAVAGVLVLRSFSQRGEVSDVSVQLPTNPSLNPIEMAALSAYISLNRDALNTPASSNETLVPFAVNPGETGGQVAERLLDIGLITDSALMRNYLRYTGYDTQLEAGSYELSASMTPAEIALALTDARPPEIVVQIPEGWRREQIAQWIDSQTGMPFTGSDFMAATSEGAPLPPEMQYPTDIASSSSFEGFLFPDTYRVALDATAQAVVHRMLLNFENRVTIQMRADAAASGRSLYEVVTLASIVEREAVVPEERPLIASVYLNRLAQGMKLEADPTVQYAMGFQPDTEQWWNLNLTQADYYNIDSPYNTYLYPGLPPGPIANPGLDSIRAVIYPQDSPYLYFRAACDGSGYHNFATTFEEHVANGCP